MANSRFEYVKRFELDDRLLPACWIVIRLDGKGFTRFCDLHGFEKPNDSRGLALMDAAAVDVMREYGDIRIAFGESDEYSFVLHKDTQLYGRRQSKLVSLLASVFTGSYVRRWPQHFPGVALQATPAFDARAVCYPSARILRDYLAWRQADTHINNLYNTCFWCLVKDGATPLQAHEQLRGTLSDYKNELLFSRFCINYNALPERYRKGSVVIRTPARVAKQRQDGSVVERERLEPAVQHVDIIGDAFWESHPQVLE
eukprot:scaffold1.g5211.t1